MINLISEDSLPVWPAVIETTKAQYQSFLHIITKELFQHEDSPEFTECLFAVKDYANQGEQLQNPQNAKFSMSSSIDCYTLAILQIRPFLKSLPVSMSSKAAFIKKMYTCFHNLSYLLFESQEYEYAGMFSNMTIQLVFKIKQLATGSNQEFWNLFPAKDEFAFTMDLHLWRFHYYLGFSEIQRLDSVELTDRNYEDCKVYLNKALEYSQSSSSPNTQHNSLAIIKLLVKVYENITQGVSEQHQGVQAFNSILKCSESVMINFIL